MPTLSKELFDPWYEKSCTRDMKTAISLPDDLFKRGEAFSKQRSLSRSELYVRAIREYLDRHDHAAIIAQLNEVYADVDSTLEPEIDALSLEALRRQDWAK
jgi:predicted transcriptional regulator